MFLNVSCHESRKSTRLARNRRGEAIMIALAILLLRHRLPSGGGRHGVGVWRGAQQFSMFGRKMPCETIVPER